MYKLIRSRYDGLKEIEQEIVQGEYKELKELQKKEFNGGCYYDTNGLEWYTEIIKVEEEKKVELERRDVRLQVFVTPRIDDKIMDLAEIMGLNKNDIVRMAIAQYMASYDATVKMIGEQIQKEMKKVSDSKVKS